MQFHFPLLHGSVCVKRSHRAITESSKLHLSNAGELPFLKNKVAQVPDSIEACYRNDQPETHKIINAYKVFFVLSLRASGMMLSLQILRFQSSNLLQISVTLKLGPSWVYQRRSEAKSLYSYNIWRTRSPCRSRSLSIKGSLIKQPRWRRHGAKTSFKCAYTLFQIYLFHFVKIFKCWRTFLVFIEM